MQESYGDGDGTLTFHLDTESKEDPEEARRHRRRFFAKIDEIRENARKELEALSAQQAEAKRQEALERNRRKSAIEMSKHWIRKINEPPKGSATHYHLVCLPHVGGTSLTYIDWRLPHADIYAIDPPGRLMNYKDPFVTDISRMVEPVVQGLESMGLLKETVTTPVGFVGHSLGALLGYEVIRYLKIKRSIHAAFFVVGGTRAPQARQIGYDFSLVEAQCRATPGDDTKLMDFILSFGWWPPCYHYHKSLPRLFLPLMRADCQAINSYAYAFDDFAMDCPILCFGSEKDAARCSRLDLEEWEQRTLSTRGVEVVMIEGPYGHNFWAGKRQEIVDCLKARIGHYLDEYREREKRRREADEGSGGGSNQEQEGEEEDENPSDEEEESSKAQEAKGEGPVT